MGDSFLLLCKKAQFPNRSLSLKREFDLTGDQLQRVYILPHTVCCEPYIKAFQYKVLNSILYTNTKLYKIGFSSDDTCSICKSHPETLSHLFFDCIYSQSFWKEFERFFHFVSKELSHSKRCHNRHYRFQTPLAKLLATGS